MAILPAQAASALVAAIPDPLVSSLASAGLLSLRVAATAGRGPHRQLSLAPRGVKEPQAFSGPAPASDPSALWERWRTAADGTAREQLICHYLADARMLAALVYARRTHSDVEFDDYLQLARIGLIEAVDRFDPSHGVRFKTFASKRVQGAVLTGLSRLTEKNQQIALKARLQRVRIDAAKEVAEDAAASAARKAAIAGPQTRLFQYLAEVGIGLALGVLLENTGMVDADAFESDAHAPPPDAVYFRKREIARLRSVLHDRVDTLGEAQQSVIRGHYLQNQPFEDIARAMGLTRGRVSQIHRQALSQLRASLGNHHQCDVSC